MTLSKKIKVAGAPRYMTFDDNFSKLYYYDKLSSNIYSLNFNETVYTNAEIMSCPNVSAIKVKGETLFVTSRTRNKLITFSLDISEVISETDLPEKPVDMILYDDTLNILCAKDNKIVIINIQTGEIEKIVELLTDGFARKLNRIYDTDTVLISDAKTGFYNVYNLKSKKVVQKNKLTIPVTIISVVDKAGIDKL